MNDIFDPQSRLRDLVVFRRRYNFARFCLPVFFIFSALSILLTAIGEYVTIVITAYFPYSVVFKYSLLTDRWPDAVYRQLGLDLAEYWGENYANVKPMFKEIFVVTVLFALVIAGVYLLCFFLSKKRPVWMVIAAVGLGIDTLLLISDWSIIMLPNFIIHLLLLFILIRGCVNGKRFREYSEVTEVQFSQYSYDYNNAGRDSDTQYYMNGNTQSGYGYLNGGYYSSQSQYSNTGYAGNEYHSPYSSSSPSPSPSPSAPVFESASVPAYDTDLTAAQNESQNEKQNEINSGGGDGSASTDGKDAAGNDGTVGNTGSAGTPGAAP